MCPLSINYNNGHICSIFTTSLYSYRYTVDCAWIQCHANIHGNVVESFFKIRLKDLTYKYIKHVDMLSLFTKQFFFRELSERVSC